MENRVQLFVIVFVRQHITKEVTIVILHISITLDSYECSRACTFFSGNDNVCFLLSSTSRSTLPLVKHFSKA